MSTSSPKNYLVKWTPKFDSLSRFSKLKNGDPKTAEIHRQYPPTLETKLAVEAIKEEETIDTRRTHKISD